MTLWDKYLGVLTGLLIVSAGGINAKPNDVRTELKRETIRAVHTPTGCAATVEYDDGIFVKAFIADPLCLPKGVAKRFIPASDHDFYIPEPVRASLTGQ